MLNSYSNEVPFAKRGATNKYPRQFLEQINILEDSDLRRYSLKSERKLTELDLIERDLEVMQGSKQMGQEIEKTIEEINKEVNV